MTTGITIGRRLVRSSMNRPSERRACRRSVSRSSAPSAIAPSIAVETACFASSMRSSASGAYTQPRVTISGPVRTSPGLGVDGQDHDDHALFGEDPPIAQHAVADVADDPVDVHVAGGHRVPFAVGALGRERDDVAVFTDDDAILRDADLARELRVVHEMPVLTVHRHEPLRLEQVEQELQLFLRRMTRDVHRRRAIVHDLGARSVERIDHARDVRLVARNRVGADHHDVVGRDLHVLVLVRGHERQRAHRLALRTGADDAHLARRELGRLLDVDHRRGRECRRSHARAPW